MATANRTFDRIDAAAPAESLLSLIDPARLQQIQKLHGGASNLPYALLDPYGDWIGDDRFTPHLCRLARQTPDGMDMCRNCSTSKRTEIENSSGAVTPFTCHLSAMAPIAPVVPLAPLRYRGRLIGYVQGSHTTQGDVRPEKLEEAAQTIANFTQFPGNPTEVKEALASLPLTPLKQLFRQTESTRDVIAKEIELQYIKLRLRMIDQAAARVSRAALPVDAVAPLTECVRQMFGSVEVSVYLRQAGAMLERLTASPGAALPPRISISESGQFAAIAARMQAPVKMPALSETPSVQLMTGVPGVTLGSVIAVPILNSQSDLVGVIQAGSPSPGHFEDVDCDLLALLASSIAGFLGPCPVEDDLGVVSGRTSRLQRNTKLQFILDAGLRILGYPYGTIGILGHTGETLHIRAAASPLKDGLPVEVNSRDGAIPLVLSTGKTQILRDLWNNDGFRELFNKHPRSSPYGAFLRKIRSSVKAVVKARSKVLGVLCVADPLTNAFPDAIVPVIESLAQLAGEIIEEYSWDSTVRDLLACPIESKHDIIRARKEACREIVNEALRITGAKAACLRINREERLPFVAVTAVGPYWTRNLILNVFHVDDNRWGSRAVRFKREVVADRSADRELFNFFPAGTFNHRAHVSVPVLLDGTVPYVLSVDGEEPFTPEDIHSLKLLARDFAVILNRFDLEKHKWLEDLHRKCLTRTGDQASMVQEALSWIRRILGARACAVYLQNSATRMLALTASDPPLENVSSVPPFRLGEGLAGWVGKNKRPLRLKNRNDLDELARVSSELNSSRTFCPRIELLNAQPVSYLAVPFDVEHNVGVIEVLVKEDGDEFSDDDRASLADIAAGLAKALLQAERERAAKRDKALAVMGLMLSSFRHETRTPLQKLTGLINLMQQDGPPPEVAEKLEQMNLQVHAVRSIVDAVTRFADGKPESFNLDDLVDSVAAKTRSEHPNMVVNRSSPPMPVRISGNRAQIERAFDLIIGNAVEAMTPPATRATLAIELASFGDYAVVTFRDNGKGMDPETLRRMFEPLFTTKGVGRGLGLTVALNIMNRHSGTITMDSRPRQGTSVAMVFPMPENPSHA